MIKFGIPSVEEIQDTFPGRAVITMNGLEKATSKRKFTFSKTAAQRLGVEPGLCKVALSFDGGNFIAVIPDSQEGIAANDRYPVNKELSFINKKAYDYMTKKFELNSSIDNCLEMTEFTNNSGMIVGTFSSTPMLLEEPSSENIAVDSTADSNSPLM